MKTVGLVAVVLVLVPAASTATDCEGETVSPLGEVYVSSGSADSTWYIVQGRGENAGLPLLYQESNGIFYYDIARSLQRGDETLLRSDSPECWGHEGNVVPDTLVV